MQGGLDVHQAGPGFELGLGPLGRIHRLDRVGGARCRHQARAASRGERVGHPSKIGHGVVGRQVQPGGSVPVGGGVDAGPPVGPGGSGAVDVLPNREPPHGLGQGAFDLGWLGPGQVVVDHEPAEPRCEVLDACAGRLGPAAAAAIEFARDGARGTAQGPARHNRARQLQRRPGDPGPAVAKGAFLALGNPRSHHILVSDEQQAIEELAAFSLIARWIDRCDVECAVV